MAKQIVVCPHHVLLVSNKKEQTADTLNDLDESPENYANLKKLNTILYDYNYITFLKCQNYRNIEMENRLVISRSEERVGAERGGCDYKRAT